MPEVSSLTDVKKFFGYDTTADFRTDWKRLSKEDQSELRTLVHAHNNG